MEQAVLEDYVTYCKDFAVDSLENLRGWNSSAYMCDLGNRLTEGINIDGSATYSRHKAKLYLQEWWYDAAEVYDYQKMHFGEVLHNPFDSPEAFHVCMIIHGVENILWQCPTIEKNHGTKKTLTTTLLNKIIKEVEQVSEIHF